MSDVKKVTGCMKCRAPIVMLTTRKNKRMPVDAATVDDGDTHYIHGKHVSHFATCKFADFFRKKR
jgi:hypothetical protein